MKFGGEVLLKVRRVRKLVCKVPSSPGIEGSLMGSFPLKYSRLPMRASQKIFLHGKARNLNATCNMKCARNCKRVGAGHDQRRNHLNSLAGR
jgi:hypothetical protein